MFYVTTPRRTAPAAVGQLGIGSSPNAARAPRLLRSPCSLRGGSAPASTPTRMCGGSWTGPSEVRRGICVFWLAVRSDSRVTWPVTWSCFSPLGEGSKRKSSEQRGGKKADYFPTFPDQVMGSLSFLLLFSLLFFSFRSFSLDRFSCSPTLGQLVFLLADINMERNRTNTINKMQCFLPNWRFQTVSFTARDISWTFRFVWRIGRR